MDIQVFDRIEPYQAEAEAKWGETQAYREYAQRAAEPDANSAETAGRLMAIFAEIGSVRSLSPAAAEVQEKIAALQQFITAHYYACTDEILNGLGQMYVGDERFRQTIDNAGGAGTAEFVRQAIAVRVAQ